MWDSFSRVYFIDSWCLQTSCESGSIKATYNLQCIYYFGPSTSCRSGTSSWCGNQSCISVSLCISIWFSEQMNFQNKRSKRSKMTKRKPNTHAKPKSAPKAPLETYYKLKLINHSVGHRWLSNNPLSGVYFSVYFSGEVCLSSRRVPNMDYGFHLVPIQKRDNTKIPLA